MKALIKIKLAFLLYNFHFHGLLGKKKNHYTQHSNQRDLSLRYSVHLFFSNSRFFILLKSFFEGRFHYFASHKEQTKTTLQLCCHMENIYILQFKFFQKVYCLSLFCNISLLLITCIIQNVRV